MRVRVRIGHSALYSCLSACVCVCVHVCVRVSLSHTHTHAHLLSRLPHWLVTVNPRPESSAGRRGLAGTLLVHKILGAMAREGKPLMEIKQVGEAILRGLGTAGAALSPCHVPGRGASFNLEPETYGFGACGE